MNPEAHKLSREVRAAMAAILTSMGEGEPPSTADIAKARNKLEELIALAGGAPLPATPVDAVEQFAQFFETTGRSIGLNGNVVSAVPRIARAWVQGYRA